MNRRPYHAMGWGVTYCEIPVLSILSCPGMNKMVVLAVTAGEHHDMYAPEIDGLSELMPTLMLVYEGINMKS